MRHDQSLCAHERVTGIFIPIRWQRLMKSALSFYLILLLCALCSFPAFSQEKTTALSDTARWASTVAEQYWIQPDITYGVANNYTLKLDVWQRKDQKTAGSDFDLLPRRWMDLRRSHWRHPSLSAVSGDGLECHQR